MTEHSKASMWRTLFSFSWRHYEMPHPGFTFSVLYLVFVSGLSGTFAVIGISSIWAFLAGGLISLLLMAVLEVRYRRRHLAK